MLNDNEYVSAVVSLPLTTNVNEPLTTLLVNAVKVVALKSPALFVLPSDGARTASDLVTFKSVESKLEVCADNLNSIVGARSVLNLFISYSWYIFSSIYVKS